MAPRFLNITKATVVNRLLELTGLAWLACVYIFDWGKLELVFSLAIFFVFMGIRNLVLPENKKTAFDRFFMWAFMGVFGILHLLKLFVH